MTIIIPNKVMKLRYIHTSSWEPQLAACDCCLFIAPGWIADCFPYSFAADFHSTRKIRISIDKSYITILLSSTWHHFNCEDNLYVRANVLPHRVWLPTIIHTYIGMYQFDVHLTLYALRSIPWKAMPISCDHSHNFRPHY